MEILFIAAGIGLLLVIVRLFKSRKNKLHEAFIKMGAFNGKSLGQFVDRCGQPTATNAIPGTLSLLATWSKDGYLITLQFDERGKFVAKRNEVNLKNKR